MMTFVYLFSALLAWFTPRQTEMAAETRVLRNDPCQIYGSVYLERDPRYKSYATHLVYIEPEEAFADMLVFEEDNKLFADKPGLWYKAKGRAFADYVFFVTDNRALADFSIHYTDVRSFAGCNR
ncbi:MAG: hypothetical protein LPJ89_08705 [Hymenobacteraceae bacterium]|nr:hypothetical protein [Hymenobacteraceae bacterium]MDX5514152.1 hypothetical protein [Hymenobacteraceae bacterium]